MKQPKQILSQRILQAVLTDLRDRKGFDDWWDNIDSDIQREAEKELQSKIEVVLSKESASQPDQQPILAELLAAHDAYIDEADEMGAGRLRKAAETARVFLQQNKDFAA